MSLPVEIPRPVARVLVLDPSDRLLLLYDDRDEQRGGFWGLVIQLGPLVHRCRARFAYRGRRYDQDEWHFLARAARVDVMASRQGDNEASAVAAHRWWSLADLKRAQEPIYPDGLAEVLRRVTRTDIGDRAR